MSMQTEDRLSIPRGNQRVLRVGPIPTGETNPDGSPVLYDATGHTAILVLKDDHRASDLIGIQIEGTVFGSLPGGFFIDFMVTAAHTAVPGTRWLRVDLISPASQPRMIVGQYITIEAV